MELNKIMDASLDDLLFERRNKDYGAYDLRKKYDRHVNTALGITLALIILGFSFPYIKALFSAKEELPKMTTVDVTKLAAPPPLDKTTPPPPPPDLPPPPPKTIKFTPPVVKPDDEVPPQDEPPTQEDMKETPVAATTSIDPNAQVNFNEAPTKVVEAAPQKPLMFVQQMPQFPGGEEALMAYLHEHIKYPNPAREGNIEGTVVLQFVVGSDGTISEIKALREVGGGCTEEAIRVVKSMPKWKPGNNNGIAVPVYFNLPVSFQLQADN